MKSWRAKIRLTRFLHCAGERGFIASLMKRARRRMGWSWTNLMDVEMIPVPSRSLTSLVATTSAQALGGKVSARDRLVIPESRCRVGPICSLGCYSTEPFGRSIKTHSQIMLWNVRPRSMACSLGEMRLSLWLDFWMWGSYLWKGCTSETQASGSSKRVKRGIALWADCTRMQLKRALIRATL